MKLIFLFLISLYALGGGFSPRVEIEKKIADCNYPLEVFTKSCEGCLEIPDQFTCEGYEILEQSQIKEEVESCINETDCQEKLASKICSTQEAEKVYTLEPNEVYCTWLRKEGLYANQTKMDAYNSAKAEKISQENELKERLEMIEKGKELVALMANRNAKKGLTPDQIPSLLSTYREVNEALSSGSLQTAQYLVSQVVPDGVIMSQEDKDFALAKIAEYLAE